MKHFTQSFLFTVLMSMVGVNAFGYNCKVDGICYDLDWTKQTATVTYSGYPYNNDYTGHYGGGLKNANIIIPSTITYNDVDYTVTAIGDRAFCDCESSVLMSSITIPSTVISIGDQAFWNCTNLTSFTIPSSVTNIGDDAFSGCSGLTSVTIPNSVTSIGPRAFQYCHGLTSITIPSSVTNIGEGAFASCSGLTTMIVESGNTKYDSRNNCNAIIETTSKTLLSGCKNTIIPNSVTTIGSTAFFGCNGLSSVTIPNSVTSIGSAAFNGCYGLSSVTVDIKTPLKIGSYTFPNRENATLYVPFGSKAAYEAADYWKEFKEIKDIEPEELQDGDTFTAQTIEGATLTYYVLSTIKKTVRVREGDNVSKVTIPETVNGFTVVSIGTEAFENCTNLTEVDIPSTVTEIKSDALGKCGFTSFVLPKTVTSISGSILYGCSNLTSVSVENGNTVYDSRENCNGIIETAANTLVLGYERTVIPTNVTAIGEDAFHFSTATDYEIPSHIVTIGDYAFYKCNLTSVIIPASVTSIGEGAFDGCQSLTTVISKITNPFAIDNNAFYYAYNTATLYVPFGTKALYEATAGWKKFANIVEMEPAELQDGDIFTANTVEGVEMIFKVISAADKTCQVGTGNGYPNAVENQYKTSGPVTIPNYINGFAVISIADFAFYECYKVTSFTIPNSVTTIGQAAFYGCEGISGITIPNSVTTIGDDAFERSGLTSIVYPENVITMGSGVFSRCSYLTNVIIPNSVTNIANSAFYECTGLNNITIPSSVTTIGNGAFWNCTALNSVSMSNSSLTTIGNNAFSGCCFSSITIPNSVASIGSSAFAYCSELTSIDIPSSVTSIGSYAFSSCSGLTSITIGKNVETIGTNPFSSCYKINSLQVESGNNNYDSRNDCNAIIETATNTLMVGCKNTIIPNTVNHIGNNAFYYCTFLTDITIPNSITSIGERSFAYCLRLQNIKIPSSVTSIGIRAFNYCKSLESVFSDIVEPFTPGAYAFILGDSTITKYETLYVPAGTKSKYQSISGWNVFNNIVEFPSYTIQTVEGVNMTVVVTSENEKTCQVGVGEYAVPAISQSTEGVVTIPSEVNGYTVTTIGVSAFQSCKKITKVNIPNTVTSIGNHAFDQCAALESVNIPNSVTTIRDGAFMECAKLASIELPNSLERLENYAFGDCPSLTSVVIPSSVTFMDMPFADCTGLISIFSEIEEPFDMNVISFTYYDETTSTRYPLTATLYVPIGTKALYQAATGWNVLTMKNIGEEDPAVFVAESTNGIEMLFKVTDEENKKCQIGTGAGTAVWKNTTGSVVLPMTVNGYTVTAIADNAFAETGISSVVIPSSIVSIGENAFKGCPNLANVKSYIEEPYSIPASAFSGISDEATISILYGTKDAYLAASGWNAFASVIDDMAIVDGIVYHVEQSEESIALVEKNTYWATYEGEMIIPEQFTINSSTFNVKGIGEAAFQNSLITAVSIPETVTSIGNLAFSNCIQLHTVKSNITEPWDFNTKFSNLPSDAVLYVPYGQKAAYEAVSTWNAFASIEEMEDEQEPVDDSDTDISSMNNVIYLNKVEANVNSQINLSIRMKNTAAIRGFQFDMYLPDGVTVVKSAKGKIISSLSDGRLPEDDEHTLTINEQSDGALRFLCGSMYDEAFTGNDGEVATLTVKMAENMKDGDYAIILRNMKLTETDISKYYETEYVKSTLTIKSYTLGDINDDGKIDVSDYIGIANNILGNDQEGFNVKAADVNQDGIVDVSDYIGVANIILTGSIYGNSNNAHMLYYLEAEDQEIDPE